LVGEIRLVGHCPDLICPLVMEWREWPVRQLVSETLGSFLVGEFANEGVQRGDEAIEEISQMGAFVSVELAQDPHHRVRPPVRDIAVLATTFFRDPDQDHSTVFRRREPLCQSVVDESLNSARRGRRIDSQARGQALHCSVVASRQEIERVHLALLEWSIAAE
jgi:hypothetical protein